MQVLQVTKKITITQIIKKIKVSNTYKRYYPGPTQHICNPNMLNTVLRNNALYESTPFARHCQTILYNKTHIGTLSYNGSQRYMPVDLTKRYTDFREIKEFKPHNFRPKQIMDEKKLDLILERMKEVSFKDPNKMIDYLLKEISVKGLMHPTILQELIIFLEQKNGNVVTEKEHLLLLLLKQHFAILPQGDIKNIKSNRCFTYQDWIEKRGYCQTLLDKLKSDQYRLYTPKEQIELWIESGILTYPDVYYKELDGTTYEYTAGEGLKVKQKAHELMKKNTQYFQHAEKNSFLSKDVIEYMLNQIKNKNYEAGLLKRDIIEQIIKGDIIEKSKEPLVLSGQDLHVVLTIKDPKDSEYRYIFGMYTSSKDEETIQVSKTQEFDRLFSDAQRPQLVRIYKKLVRVKESNFQRHPHATRYSTRHSKEGSDVPQILLHGLMENIEEMLKNPIEEPIDFTNDILNMLAILSFEASIQECNKEIEKMEKLNSDQRGKKIMSREKQKANFLKDLEINKQIKSLTKQDKLLYKIMQLLEKHVKKIEKDKQNKKPILEQMIQDADTSFKNTQNEL